MSNHKDHFDLLLIVIACVGIGGVFGFSCGYKRGANYGVNAEYCRANGGQMLDDGSCVKISLTIPVPNP